MDKVMHMYCSDPISSDLINNIATDANLRIASLGVMVPGEGVKSTHAHPPAAQLLCSVAYIQNNTTQNNDK